MERILKSFPPVVINLTNDGPKLAWKENPHWREEPLQQPNTLVPVFPVHWNLRMLSAEQDVVFLTPPRTRYLQVTLHSPLIELPAGEQATHRPVFLGGACSTEFALYSCYHQLLHPVNMIMGMENYHFFSGEQRLEGMGKGVLCFPKSEEGKFQGNSSLKMDAPTRIEGWQFFLCSGEEHGGEIAWWVLSAELGPRPPSSSFPLTTPEFPVLEMDPGPACGVQVGNGW